MCRQRKKTHPPRESQNIKKIKSLHFSSASPVLLPTNHFIGPHKRAGLRNPEAGEGSVLVKNPENERPPRGVDFSTKKSHFYPGTRADPGVPLIWGDFGGKLSLSRGGRSLRQGGSPNTILPLKIEKYDPPLTKITL